jgi:hypothetical protein
VAGVPLAAVFAPCAPILVPEVASGAAAELDGLRADLDAALAEALALGPTLVWVLAPGERTGRHDPDGRASFSGFGVEVSAGGAGAPLPAPLSVGAWLLDRAGWTGDRAYTTVCAGGTGLPEAPDDVVVLALGDGPATLTERAPGSLHPAAQAYDDTIAAALGSGDPARLAALDAATGAQTMAAGSPVWRAAGGVLTGRFTVARQAREMPYGVGYHVALWLAS